MHETETRKSLFKGPHGSNGWADIFPYATPECPAHSFTSTILGSSGHGELLDGLPVCLLERHLVSGPGDWLVQTGWRILFEGLRVDALDAAL